MPAPTREQVISTGTRLDFFVCPLCCLNRKITERGATIRFDNFDFGEHIIQARYTGGRGSGFWKNDTESKTLEDILEDPEYADQVNQIREQCKKILEAIGP